MGGRQETDARSSSRTCTHTHTTPSLHLLSLRCFSGERVKVKAERRVMKWWAILYYLNFFCCFSPNSFQFTPSRTGQEGKGVIFFFLSHPYKLINTINNLTLVKECSIHAVSSLFHPCTVLYAWAMPVVSFWVISNQGALVRGPLSSLMLSLWMHEFIVVVVYLSWYFVICQCLRLFIPSETINRGRVILDARTMLEIMYINVICQVSL